MNRLLPFLRYDILIGYVKPQLQYNLIYYFPKQISAKM